jgi:hypothetical protein
MQHPLGLNLWIALDDALVRGHFKSLNTSDPEVLNAAYRTARASLRWSLWFCRIGIIVIAGIGLLAMSGVLMAVAVDPHSRNAGSVLAFLCSFALFAPFVGLFSFLTVRTAKNIRSLDTGYASLLGQANQRAYPSADPAAKP